jgi:hypothetical protein
MQLRDAVEERLSHRRERARRRAAAPAATTAELRLDRVPVAAAGPPTAEVPLPVEIAQARDFAPSAARGGDEVREVNPQHAFEAAAAAARSIAEEFAQARARAEREWSRPAQPEPMLAGSTEDDRPDDAAPVKIGAFAPQFIAPAEPVPMAQNPSTREMGAAPRARWPRRGNSEG